MQNLNIQQKVILAAQKSKEHHIKASNLTDEQLRQLDYTENTRPNLSEEQTAMIHKYMEKLHVLGDYKEIDIYGMMKKYDWNVKVLDDLTTVMIKKVEETNDADDWIEVKRVRKDASKKRTREEREGKRFGRTTHGEDEDTYIKGRPNTGVYGKQGGFRKKVRRGHYFLEEGTGHTQKRGYRFNKERFGDAQNAPHHRGYKSRNEGGVHGDFQKRGYNKSRRTEDVYVPKHLRKQNSEEIPAHSVKQRRFVEKFVYVKKVKSDTPVVAGSAATEEKIVEVPSADKENQEVEKKETERVKSVSHSPDPKFTHYKENINEFSSKPDDTKKETKLTEDTIITNHKTLRETSSLLNLNVEGDTTSKSAQKPFFEKPIQKEKPQQQPETIHEQPIGPSKTQAHQTTTPITPPSTHATTTTPTSGNVTHTTQSSHSKSEPKTESPQPQQPTMYGYPQYMQQPYMMPQYPQQGYYNPYLAFYPPQQTATTTGKDQQQQTGSYPPGFNPQDMSSMYQMPYVLVPQPNGTTILQPMYGMMPQGMTQQPTGPQTTTENEQNKFTAQPQPYFQYGMGQPMNISGGYYGTPDDKKSKHPYEQKAQNIPTGTNMGPFFNFGHNETDHKNKGTYMPQQGTGYPFMPFIMQPNAMHPGQYQPHQQHYHGKSTETNTGNRW